MKMGVVTLFPSAFDYILEPERSGLVGKATSKEISIYVEDLRTHGLGKHKIVDDSPYGGGDGMVLKPEPLALAFKSLSEKMSVPLDKIKKIFLDPKGDLWTQKRADKIMADMRSDTEEKPKAIILLCGRYAGVDERFIESYIDERVSLGPFILNGGELPALCVIESILRLVPEVLGNPQSSQRDSFSQGLNCLIEPPVYTRPQSWNNRSVPEVLTSGNHKKIKEFEQRLSLTASKLWFSKAIELFEEGLCNTKKQDKS